jgi:hypothetical protein
MKSRLVGAVVSSSAGKRSDWIAFYGRGRVCGASGCGTLLSTYNPALYCSVHVAAGTPRPRP